MDRQTIDDLARKLMVEQKAMRVAEHAKVWEPLSTTATDLGYECERRIVYHRCYPKDAAPFGDELLSIFSEGDLHQKDVRRELGALGYEVVQSETRFADKRLDIAGTIDGMISLPGDRNTHTQRRIPIEIKSTSGAPPTTQDGLRHAENGLYRRYYAQMITYLYLAAEPFGVFIFKNKIDGLWSVVPVELDYAYAENLLKRAERVRDIVRLWTDADDDISREACIPERIANRSECTGCPWAQTKCFPADAPVDQLLLAAEPVLIATLTEREQLDPAATRFDKLDKALKERLKLTKFDRLVVGGDGGFLIEKKIQKNGVRILIQRLAA